MTEQITTIELALRSLEKFIPSESRKRYQSSFVITHSLFHY